MNGSTCVSFGLPDGPHFEGVDFAAALNAFVADVVTHVVILVPLEKVRGAQRMASTQQSAPRGERKHGGCGGGGDGDGVKEGRVRGKRGGKWW